jgi:hypothetical protein
MNARRDFLRKVVPMGALGAVALNTDWLDRIVSAGAAVADRLPADVASDEGYWRDIQQAFTLDRTIINLNNGYTCPSPRVVHEALKRYLDSSNQAPIHFMWNTLEPNVEQVRRKLAVEVGCDMEELAITRNASEGLQICQLGLDLQAGDHVVTTNQDYGRMLDTWDQRVRRDKIAVTKIAFPVPTTNISELTDRITRAITPKTKVIHICHITNLTGQLFPVRDIARMARSRGILTIVDGAVAVIQPGVIRTEMFDKSPGFEYLRHVIEPQFVGTEVVTRAIAKAIEKERFELFAPSRYGIVWKLRALLPRTIMRGTLAFVRRRFEGGS